MKNQFGRPVNIWEDNIKIDLTEIGFEEVDWIHLAQNMVHHQVHVNTAMNF
jgi:hypothetical protein